MKKNNNLILGLIFIVLGIIFGLKTLGICDINVFFKGWWTLFIIIPCFIGLIKDNDKTASIIGLVFGIMLLLDVRSVIDTDLFWKLFLPLVLIIVGLSVIFKDTLNKKIKKEISKVEVSDNKKYITATFGEQKVDYDKEVFEGVTINAVFGGVKLDLRNAKIKEDVLVNTTSIFGGVDIYLPEKVNVKVVSSNIFGGVDNKVKNEMSDKQKTIYINSTNIFGGTDIK